MFMDVQHVDVKGAGEATEPYEDPAFLYADGLLACQFVCDSLMRLLCLRRPSRNLVFGVVADVDGMDRFAEKLCRFLCFVEGKLLDDPRIDEIIVFN